MNTSYLGYGFIIPSDKIINYPEIKEMKSDWCGSVPVFLSQRGLESVFIHTNKNKNYFFVGIVKKIRSISSYGLCGEFAYGDDLQLTEDEISHLKREVSPFNPEEKEPRLIVISRGY